MSAIDIKGRDNLELVVRQADTQVVAYLNGDEVYDKYGAGEGAFEERTNLMPLLQKGYNVLLVLGLRYTENYKYDVEVLLNGRALKNVDSTTPRSPTGNGIVWDFSVEINRLGA